MFRKGLIDMLLGNPMSVTQIARLVREPPKQIADDLEHLLRSLKHTEYRAMIEPARCRACGFEFGLEKLSNYDSKFIMPLQRPHRASSARTFAATSPLRTVKRHKYRLPIIERPIPSCGC